MHRWLPIGCLVLGLVLAGCAAAPTGESTPQERPVFVNLTNAADRSHTLELWVAEDPLTGIRVHRSTGGDYTTRTSPAGLSTTAPGPHTITSLTFPKRAALYGRYTLAPGATRTWTMAEPYPETVFVVVVYDGDRVTVWNSVTCDGVLYGFGVEATATGGPGAYHCL